jgi:putative phage-type endonuclease
VSAIPEQRLSRAGIGASEIASIVGLNPYASPWDVWLEKTGQREPFTGNQFTEWGHRLEPAIRQAYCDKTGHAIEVPTDSLFHPTTSWARATPDGFVIEGTKRVSLVQCKNVGTWVEKSWKDAPPDYVQLQEQWEMYVTELARADVSVLIGGNDFRIYTIHRDDKVIGDLVKIAADFWRRVETKTPPAVDGSDACQRHIERRFAKSDAIVLDADAELEHQMTEWQRLHLMAKTVEKRIKVLKNKVRTVLADAKADRIRSSVGTTYLQSSGTLCSPREWAKESA